MPGQLSRRDLIVGSAASLGVAAISPSILTTGRAKFHGLHNASTDAARRAVIEEMVATNRPLDFNLSGTYELDRFIDLSNFTGRSIELSPQCTLKSNGSGGLAHVFFSRGADGIRIRGGILKPGQVISSFLHGHAIRFDDAVDCRVEETVVEEAVRGAILFNGSIGCGWYEPVCRRSLLYASPPADHSGFGYDFHVTGGAVDFKGDGGLSYEGGGIGFSVQSLAGGSDDYDNVVMTGWRVVRALAYGAMLYRSSDESSFTRITLYGDLVDTVYGNVPAKGSGLYLWGAGVYVQGVEGALAGARVIRNTHASAPGITPSEQLAPGAIGITNCTSFVARAEVIEDCWYGVTARDPLGEGNPGKTVATTYGVAGPNAPRDGRGIVDVGVIRRSREAAVHQRNFPVMEVSARVEQPFKRAFYAMNAGSVAGRSLCERSILKSFTVIGGAAQGGSGTQVAAVECAAGALEYLAGSIEGYKGLRAVQHTGPGAIILGRLTLDGRMLSGQPLIVTGSDAGVHLASGTGSITGTTFSVTELESGYFRPGAIISGRGVAADTRIVRILTGEGGLGAYEVTISQIVASAVITATTPAERSRIAPGATVICNSLGHATHLSRPLRGLEEVSYIGAGRAPDLGTFKRTGRVLQ